MPDELKPSILQAREIGELTSSTDSRDYLYAAARQQKQQYDDYELIIDIDAHLQEGRFWPEILQFVENDVLKYTAQHMQKRGVNNPLVPNASGLTFQAMDGRVGHQEGSREATPGFDKPGESFAEIMRRSMDGMGIDYQVIFPTAMLNLGLNAMEDIEVYLGRAYMKWLTEIVFPHDKRLIGFAYLPFNTPDEAEKIVREYGHHPQIIGFSICSVRYKPVWHNTYMRLYKMIEETGKPLSFHSGVTWSDQSFAQLNRFVSMHALSFVHFNLIHLTNWVINALPERFPKLKTIWIESGLAWIPYLMQRLDHEVLLRPSEAPGLKRLPSEYMQDMYFSSQPMERTDLKLLQSTLEKIKAETQLLYASDWPHWDFDPPSSITALPFLSEQAKKNILGLNAAKLFNLPIKRMRPRAEKVLVERAGLR
jgi:predicted TIM-barrel fold metal-dependent hydrolase